MCFKKAFFLTKTWLNVFKKECRIFEDHFYYFQCIFFNLRITYSIVTCSILHALLWKDPSLFHRCLIHCSNVRLWAWGFQTLNNMHILGWAWHVVIYNVFLTWNYDVILTKIVDWEVIRSNSLEDQREI